MCINNIIYITKIIYVKIRKRKEYKLKNKMKNTR